METNHDSVIATSSYAKKEDMLHELLESSNRDNMPMSVMAIDGEIFSIRMGKKELMHGGAKPYYLKTDADHEGWQHSEIVMFPIVGPVKGYTITTEKGKHILDQHGISRSMPWTYEQTPAGRMFVQQNVDDNHPLVEFGNSKHSPGSPRPPYLLWRHPFRLTKEIYFNPGLQEVTIDFMVQNLGKEPMPYMVGWHPAFRLQGHQEAAVFKAYASQQATEPKHTYSFGDILEASKGDGELQLDGISRIEYAQTDNDPSNGFVLCSPTFKKMMLWTPYNLSGMFCIEPTTHFPHPDPKKPYFQDHDLFLQPGDRAKYRVQISG